MVALVRHEVLGPTLIIWNCNSARRNALSSEYYDGVIEGLANASRNPKLASVVLAGEGGFFCSGGDLNSLRERRDLPEEKRRDRVEHLHSVIRAIRDCPKPVLAAVEGGAAGAGLSIAMACDMIVAAQSAKFTLAYVKAGLVPDGGASYALMQAMPRATAARMALLGEPLGAERMYELGAVSEIVADGQAVNAACDLGERLAKGPEQSIANIKTLLNRAETATLQEQLDAERNALAQAFGGAEAAEGISAFLEKRKPVFR